MALPDSDWDIKLTLSSTSHKLRLLSQKGQKAWQVKELPPAPVVADPESSAEGFDPLRGLSFEMHDWAYGVGLDKLGRRNLPGHTLRAADGDGIDLSEPGIVKHGPTNTTVQASLQGGDLMRLIMFDGKVWAITAQRAYTYTGSTWAEFENLNSTQSVTAIKDVEVFGGKLYVCADGTDYLYTDGSASFTKKTDNADFLLTLGQRFYRAYDTNLIAWTLDPAAGSVTWSSAITVGSGEAITNMFSLSGLPFVCTLSTVYVIVNDEPIELTKLLQTRRRSTAFSIKSNSGGDVWLSDGRDIIRIVAQDFEVFDIRPDGPFHGTDEIPYSSNIAESIIAITQDVDNVYVMATDDTSTWIYKGKEVERGRFAWSPLVKVAGGGKKNAAGVFELSGDSTPFLYVGAGANLLKYAIPWTAYIASWTFVTPFFTAGLETVNKMFHRLKAFIELSDITKSKITVSYRLDTTAAFAVIGSDGEMIADGHNEIQLTAPLTGRKIQLKFVGSTTDGAESANLRSFDLKGLLRPELERVFDFTVIADTKTQADFLWSLRTDTSVFFTVVDRFNVSYTCFLMPGFPVELEMFDEIRKEPVRAYHLVAVEVS